MTLLQKLMKIPYPKQTTKCLGVYINDKLTWSDHITNLKKAISRSVGIFYRIRHYLNERALKFLF